MRATWTWVFVAACKTAGPLSPPLLQPASGPGPQAAAPGTWREAICRADLDAARALASNEVEAGLADEMARAYGEGPDLQRLADGLASATPEQREWLEAGLTHWVWIRGDQLGATWPDPKTDPQGRARSSAQVPVPAEPFTVPLRVEAETGRTFVEVTVGGQPRWFLVDTGANVSVVSESLLQGAPSLGEAAYDNVGQQGVGRYVEVDLALGPLQLPDTVVLALPPSSLPGVEVELVGILGWPILRRMRVELDFVTQRATFGPPGEPTAEPTLLWWDGYPLVRGWLQGRSSLMWLDTGGRTRLLTGVRERGIELASGPTRRTRAQTLAGRVTLRQEMVPGPVTVRIGETEAVLGGPVPLLDMPRETSWCFDAWLGLDAFQGGVFVLDATAGELSLRAP
jgi:hypothetical protein